MTNKSSPKQNKTPAKTTPKNILIKTEPGGRVVFRSLQLHNAAHLINLIKSKSLDDDQFDEIIQQGGNYVECEGVFNDGEEGQIGNEGRIVFDDELSVIVTNSHNGNLPDKGIFLLHLSLSKVSIEFDFIPNDNKSYNRDKLSELSVPVRLPKIITHDIYGHPNFNIVVDYLYNDIPIDTYDRELVDRGYEDQRIIFFTKNNKAKVVYSSFNGEAEFTDPATINEICALVTSSNTNG